MGEREEPGALWRFGDSPFTWGGIGVIVGSAIVSPTWFKFAFVGGGMAIAIGILRAKPFNGRSSRFRFAANLALLACLGIGWRLLWKVIPAPVEPLTKQEAQELFRQNANQSQPVSQIPPPEDARSPLTKADFLKLLQQYKFAGNTVGNDKIPSLPAVTPNPQALGLSGQLPAPRQPVIISVPNSFEDGTITGKNLATGMADLFIQLNVKHSSATGDYRDEGLAGRDRLLGDLRSTNLVAVPKDCIQQWSDSSINLRFTRDFWPSILGRVKSEAENRKIAPLNESEIEVCYQIKELGEPPTEEVCPK